MRGRLQQTGALMARTREHLAALKGAGPGARADGPDRLAELPSFGSNPGALRMLAYVPAELAPDPALVVVLHGCTQTARGYDLGAGWSTLADRFGFALLYPEQTSANNPRTCFNWFQPDDIGRDRGEAASIRQGVERMVLDHGLDRGRVFVTGLSAGGAMAGVMLATYPEVFAAGAIIAGLPYGCASSVNEALGAMFTGTSEPPRLLGDRVRAASPHRGPWPAVSVWHGSSDKTVVPANADETVKQWLDVHGLAAKPASESLVDGYPRRVWRDAAGREVVEAFAVQGMAHGTPLSPSAPEDPHGQAGPFLLDVGIASSLHIARFWGLTGWRSSGRDAPAGRPAEDDVPALAPVGGPSAGGSGYAGPMPGPARGGIDVGSVINRALRSAGLVKD